jgi:histidyl-tRNA synthetase
MERVKPRIPPGMRDFTPTEVRQREWVIGRIRTIFERYGYEPIETPTLELFETLKGKLGDEGEQLIFKVLRRGTALEDLRLGRVKSVTIENFDEVVDYALPYDLTVPFARYLAMHPDLPRPFKRYQIQRVWRADRPQRGRYREFYQCDVDVAGSSAMAADAEMVAIVVEALLDLGFRDFVTHIGHRKLLSGLVESVGGREHLHAISVAIDKFDKIGSDGVLNEMRERGVPVEIAESILSRLAIEGSHEEILAQLEPALAGTECGWQGVAETRELFAILAAMGVPEKHYRLNLRLVRGLDYYTGPVYESIVEQPAIGSLTGGGRYDGLIGRFLGQPLPATGTSIGLERIIDVMREFKMLPDAIRCTDVLVAVFDEPSRVSALGLAAELRRSGLRVELPLQPAKGLRPQIAYASAKAIPVIAILGPDEITAGTVTLRTGPGQQRTVPRAQAAEELRALLAEPR